MNAFIKEIFRLIEFMQSQADAAHQVLQAVKDFRQTAKPIVRDACRYNAKYTPQYSAVIQYILHISF